MPKELVFVVVEHTVRSRVLAPREDADFVPDEIEQQIILPGVSEITKSKIVDIEPYESDRKS